MRPSELKRAYADLVAKLETISADRERQIREWYPECPEDVLEFLRVVGAGEIGDAALMIYNGLVPAAELYGPGAADALRNVLMIGDDFQGYGIGFDTRERWKVVEVQPGTWSRREVAPDFNSFVERTLERLRPSAREN